MLSKKIDKCCFLLVEKKLAMLGCFCFSDTPKNMSHNLTTSPAAPTPGSSTEPSVSQISTTSPPPASTEKNGGTSVAPALSTAPSVSQDEADSNEDPSMEEEDLLALNSSPSTAKDTLDNGDYGEPDYDWTTNPRDEEPDDNINIEISREDRRFRGFEDSVKVVKLPPPNREDSHFFFHLLIFAFCAAVVYVTYHNKRKVSWDFSPFCSAPLSQPYCVNSFSWVDRGDQTVTFLLKLWLWYFRQVRDNAPCASRKLLVFFPPIMNETKV